MIVKSNLRNYEVIFQNQIFDSISIFDEKIKDKYSNLYFFIDKNVYDLYEKKFRNLIHYSKYLLIEAIESNKEYIKVAEYFAWLIENKFTRQDALITIGGGILQDISGFIASTLYRGINWFFFPTTLLSQADSCIGSKTSINFGDSKNLIGTFYPPFYIFNDRSFCSTLSDSAFNSGIGEIIKFHLLSNKERYKLLLEYLEGDVRNSPVFEDVVRSTLEIKYNYFSTDEFDTGRRNLLNYGHCFGHALESATHFGISHGEAVIVGMGFANLLAFKRGLMTKEKHYEFEKIFERFYPQFDINKISVDTIIHYLKKDKKRVGKDLTLIMLSDIGDAKKYDDVMEYEIRDTYVSFFKQYGRK